MHHAGYVWFLALFLEFSPRERFEGGLERSIGLDVVERVSVVVVVVVYQQQREGICR